MMDDPLSQPPGGAEPAAEALEPRALDALRMLDPVRQRRLVAAVVAIYLDDAPLRLEQMAAGLGCGDADALRRAAHALKSASANVGARRLAGYCREIEAGAPRGNMPMCRSLFAAAQEEYRRVAAALREIPEMTGDHVAS